MFRFIFSLVVLLDSVVIIAPWRCDESSQQTQSYCYDNVEIKYPFWYDDGNRPYHGDYDYPPYCGYPGFGIRCAENRSATVMNISNQLYSVTNFDFQSRSVRVKKLGIEREECPHPIRNFSLQEFGSSLRDLSKYKWIFFYNCSDPPINDDFLEPDQHLACLDNSGRRSYFFPTYTYEFVKTNSTFDWNRKCDDPVVVPYATGKGVSFDLPIGHDYAADARIGFDLGWSVPMGDCKDCENSGGLCNYNITGGGFNKCACKVSTGFWEDIGKTCPKKGGLSTGRKVLIGVFTGLGALLVVLLLTYIAYRKSNSKSSKNVETFLQSFGNLALQRYKYSDIKKMTNSFKDTLGKGGYGCVFKGKLTCDGRLVAVKMLNESKGNGEDFINEVATIGRTNHVNVVSLLGFCIEGTKRALVYEFMPNGSLERFIYNEKTSNTPLGWEKLYQIALGIARGLEYLHRGCNTRILHFDIKPHNILLDQEFCPKISDFGLAKLCPTRESVVSMLVARGTIGYIAPEVYCSNFGGVSHKSDVYSYGMMVFEIIGGRKNIDPTVENISEIYFPQWVYNHLIKQDINVEGSGEIFKDEITKKMIIVASWCIQLQPADRPSISKVVEMLEGSAEDLQMPPNPFQDPPSRSSP